MNTGWRLIGPVILTLGPIVAAIAIGAVMGTYPLVITPSHQTPAERLTWWLGLALLLSFFNLLCAPIYLFVGCRYLLRRKWFSAAVLVSLCALNACFVLAAALSFEG
jgi:hypothetical protein